MSTYEFKTKHFNQRWEDTPVRETIHCADDLTAQAHAQDLANTYAAETRWNHEGSGQGHYVFPEPTKPAILSVSLRNGLRALAKKTEYGLYAYTYANHTQAARKRDELIARGIPCFVTALHPFHIILDD